jgi:hypothetical protein
MPIYTKPTDIALLDPQILSQTLLLAMEEASQAAGCYDERTAVLRPAPGQVVCEGDLWAPDRLGRKQFAAYCAAEPGADAGYQQEDWIAVQHYANRPWQDVLALWQALNLHLAHVIAHVKKEDLGTSGALAGRT